MRLPMKKIVYLVPILIIFIAILPSIFGQDATQWDNAKQKFIDKKGSKNPDMRMKVAKQLSEAMYPAVELECATLLTEDIIAEVERAKDSLNKEEQIKYQVIDACVNGLMKITKPNAIDYLLKVAQDEKVFWRDRFYVLQALTVISDTKISAVMLKMIDDKWVPNKCAALRGLARAKTPDGIERTFKLLKESLTWEVKMAAMDYLEKVSNNDMVEPLINVLQNAPLEGMVRIRIADLLKKLTNADCGLSGKLWQDWLDKKKQGENPDLPKDDDRTVSIIPTLYYGITVTTNRIIFIIDTSGSMGMTASYTDFTKHDDSKDPYNKIITGPDNQKDKGKDATNQDALKKLKELKSKSDNKAVTNRLDAASKELVNTIYYLDPAVQFTMIFFNAGQNIWKDTLVTATIDNKISAIEFISKKIGVGGGTAMYDALELAYKYTGKEKETSAPTATPGKSPVPAPPSSGRDGAGPAERIVKLDKMCNYMSAFGGADTFFMVTDGAPTLGKIIDKDEILNEIKKINQFRCVKINIVAIGEPPLNPNYLDPELDVDVKFLMKLADATGGIFTDKTAKVPNKPGKK